MKYRKKPVVIEAVQWDPAKTPSEYPDWYSEAIGETIAEVRLLGEVRIFTLEGVMTAKPGDWVIRGVKGELYPCKDDIFMQTYEPVEEP